MATNDTNCSCLIGTPVVDANGNCTCINNGGRFDRLPPEYEKTQPPPIVIKYWQLPAFGSGPAGTIFGLSPLVVLGAAAIGIWMLSSKGEK